MGSELIVRVEVSGEFGYFGILILIVFRICFKIWDEFCFNLLLFVLCIFFCFFFGGVGV